MSRLTDALREWRRRTTSWRARSRVRRQARRLTDNGHWLPAPISTSAGFAINGLDEAMAEACNHLGLTLVDQPRHGYLDRSRSATVSAADGALCWLKVNGITGSAAQWLRAGEETAGQIQGVPRPTIIKIADWNADSDAWIGDLKASLHSIGRLPSPRRRFEPKRVSRLLADRFNLNAPIRVEEWRTSHGDIQWNNLPPLKAASSTHCYINRPKNSPSGRFAPF